MRTRDTLPLVPVPDTAAIFDLEERLKLLRAAVRPNRSLTEGRHPTADGHLLSAITGFERELARLRMG
jgi:hypothetical protein